jgi:hypothetical protein
VSDSDLDPVEILIKWVRIIPGADSQECKKNCGRRSVGGSHSCCDECYNNFGKKHSAYCDAREFLRHRTGGSLQETRIMTVEREGDIAKKILLYLARKRAISELFNERFAEVAHQLGISQEEMNAFLGPFLREYFKSV